MLLTVKQITKIQFNNTFFIMYINIRKISEKVFQMAEWGVYSRVGFIEGGVYSKFYSILLLIKFASVFNFNLINFFKLLWKK